MRSRTLAAMLVPGACATVAILACSGHDPRAVSASDRTANDGGADALEGGCVPHDAGGLDPSRVAAGRDLVDAYRCQQCHGGSLQGNDDGVQSPQTEGGFAYPPNLTPDPTTGIGCWTDEQIANAFLYDMDNEGNSLCPPMHPFAEAGVDASGALDIVAFLRSLPPFKLRVPDTPSCTLEPPDGMADVASSAASDAVAHDP